MTTPTHPPAAAATAEALLDAVTAARWPDGSPLVDVAPEVLRERLLPELLTAIESRPCRGVV